MSEHESSETTIIVNDPSTTQSPEKDPLRICKICGLKAYTKTDLKLFTKNKNCLYDRQPRCKKCTAKLRRKYRQENKEKIKKQGKKYRQEHKEEIKERSKKYYQENKEKILNYARKHYQENKEKIKKRVKKYYQDHYFLYKLPNGYLEGDGCCMWPGCHNIIPFELQNHHLWKEDDPDFTITLCANHHEYFTRSRSAFLDFFIKEE